MRKRLMKKIVGILTLNGNFNYGNKLQNYALQYFIESLGYNAETISYDFKIKKNKFQKLVYSIKKLLRNLFRLLHPKETLKTIKRVKWEKRCYQMREQSFKNFTDKYIHTTEFKVDHTILQNPEKLNYINKRYITAFVGSDQVWNYFDVKAFPYMFFLPFFKQEKRNSFAASFGFTEIPDDKFKINYANSLRQMNKISIREESGRNIIQGLIEKDVSVVLDPTFLLSRKEWLALSKPCLSKPKEKYMISFFLGEVTSKYKDIINRISNENGLKVINLNDFKDDVLYKIPPEEFIDLFSEAAFVITDSFHGTVFSIIFHVPFFVVDRVAKMVNMNTRIINLLEKFGLSNRYIKDGKNCSIENISIDFGVSNAIIRSNYNQSKQFIYDAVK